MNENDPHKAMPDFSVRGQHVLITGGTGGIGGAFARAFAAGGASVTVTDLREPAGPLAAGIGFVPLDVRDERAVDAAAAAMPACDVLIHCAGRLQRHEEFKIETFKDVLDIHLVGAMRMSNAFHDKLKARPGCIILIGSMYSYFGAAMIPAYASAKTAIVGLTRSLAIAYAGDGIRVNAISPGWINTPISRRGREEPAFNDKVMARLPTKRWSEPEELAGTALFLASPASALINGVTIPVDGGYTAS
jgi:NAD(P)-dependent dehydrogenase (short-subunit alcohol dehydrogenase family)